MVWPLPHKYLTFEVMDVHSQSLLKVGSHQYQLCAFAPCEIDSPSHFPLWIEGNNQFCREWWHKKAWHCIVQKWLPVNCPRIQQRYKGMKWHISIQRNLLFFSHMHFYPFESLHQPLFVGVQFLGLPAAGCCQAISNWILAGLHVTLQQFDKRSDTYWDTSYKHAFNF